MPKSKNKNKRAEGKGREKFLSAEGGSEDDSVIDNASIISLCSENSCDETTAYTPFQEEEETPLDDSFEEKLKDDIDQLVEKSAQGRTSAYNAVGKAFISRVIPEFVFDRYVTICDAIAKSLKKGKNAERAASADVAKLLIIQLGMTDESELVYKELKPILITILNDVSVSTVARAKSAICLGTCTFLAENDLEEIKCTAKVLENVFSKPIKKSEGTDNSSNEVFLLYNGALTSWNLLLTLLTPLAVLESINRYVSILFNLLESSDVNLRITAGESLALLHEIAWDHDPDYEFPNTAELLALLKQLATDSHKYRAKKDRKQQRSSFRDVLKFVEEAEYPYISVKFGIEVLVLDSWVKKIQYDGFCQILGSGMNLHLQENELLREVFQLGAPIPASEKKIHKTSKLERHMYNMAAFKARTLQRNKVRDKRSVVL